MVGGAAVVVAAAAVAAVVVPAAGERVGAFYVRSNRDPTLCWDTENDPPHSGADDIFLVDCAAAEAFTIDLDEQFADGTNWKLQLAPVGTDSGRCLEPDGTAAGNNDALRVQNCNTDSFSEFHFDGESFFHTASGLRAEDVSGQIRMRNSGSTAGALYSTFTLLAADTLCGDGFQLPNIAYEECDDGNNMSGDGCSANCTSEYAVRDNNANVLFADLGTCLADSSGKTLFASTAEAEEHCTFLGSFADAHTPGQILEAFFPDETCESVRFAPADHFVCPAILEGSAEESCLAHARAEAAWYACRVPPLCAHALSPQRMYLLAVDYKCSGVAASEPSVFEVTTDDGVSPLFACESAADVRAELAAASLPVPADAECRPVAASSSESLLDDVVALAAPGQRCLTALRSDAGALGACPDAGPATEVSCLAYMPPEADWWVCDLDAVCNAPNTTYAMPTTTMWLVALPPRACNGTHPDATIYQVEAAPRAQGLAGLKRVQRPFVRSYVSGGLTNHDGILWPGMYNLLDGTSGGVHTPDDFARDITIDSQEGLDIPEGLTVTAYRRRFGSTYTSSSDVLVLEGPFLGDMPGVVNDVVEAYFVAVTPGYYVDVWRSDLFALAAAHKASVEAGLVALADLEDASEGLYSVELNYADSYAGCDDVRDNMPDFVEGVSVGSDALARIFNGDDFATEMDNSPLVEDSTLPGEINIMNSFVVAFGVSFEAYIGSDFTNTMRGYSSGMSRAMHRSKNDVNSIRLVPFETCTSKPRLGLCGLRASSANHGIGEVFYDEACFPPTSTCSAADFAGIYDAPDVVCRPLRGAITGQSLANATEHHAGQPCSWAGVSTADAGEHPAPVSDETSARCADIVMDQGDGLDDYLCSVPRRYDSARGLMWVRARPDCSLAEHRTVAWMTTAPCLADPCPRQEAAERQHQQAAINQRSSDDFTVWGATSCPDTASLVYSGRAAGSPSGDAAGSASLMCLDLNGAPDSFVVFARSHGSSHDNLGADLSSLMSVEYSGTGSALLEDLGNSEMPCAVCRVARRTAWIQYGSDTCPAGHTTLVPGFLVAPSNDEYRGEFVCMTQTPEAAGNPADDSGNRNTLLVEGQLSLPTGDYSDGEEVNCAVCGTPRDDTGAVFVHVGAPACPELARPISEGTLLAAPAAAAQGGGSQYLCLSPVPTHAADDGVQRDESTLRTTQWRTAGFAVEALNGLSFFEAQCSICQSMSGAHSMMVPGTSACPSGSVAEYTGWLFAQNSDQFQSEFVCASTESVPTGTSVPTRSDSDTAALYPATTAPLAGAQIGHHPNASIPCAQCTRPDGRPTYVRWGTSLCPATADRVYHGMAMASTTSATNIMCVHPRDTVGPNAELLAGAVLDTLDVDLSESFLLRNRDLGSGELPCAVCAARNDPMQDVSDVTMAAGTVECPAEHRVEYSGRLLSRGSTEAAAGRIAAICVDTEVQPMEDSSDRSGIETLREAQVQEPAMDAQVAEDEVSCVVCAALEQPICTASDFAPLYDVSQCQYVGSDRGQSLAEALPGEGPCSSAGAFSTDPSTCAPDWMLESSVSCAETGLPEQSPHLDLYLCDHPLTCAAPASERVLVRAFAGTCDFHSHARVAWTGESPAPVLPGSTPGVCAAGEFGGILAGGSCRPLGRNAAASTLVSEFLEATAGLECLAESPRGASLNACPAALDADGARSCDGRPAGGVFDWHLCSVAESSQCAAPADEQSVLVVRTAPGSCSEVLAVSKIEVAIRPNATECTPADLGGVFGASSASCSFVGQAGFETLAAAFNCTVAGPLANRVDVCPPLTLAGTDQPCSQVRTGFPLDNYMCDFPTSCATRDGEAAAALVRTIPGTCRVVEQRTIGLGSANVQLWADVDVTDGSASDVSIELVDRATKTSLGAALFASTLVSGFPVQAPVVAVSPDTDLAAIEVNVTTASTSSNFTIASVSLFSAPGADLTAPILFDGDCMDALISGFLGDATGPSVASFNLSAADPASALGQQCLAAAPYHKVLLLRPSVHGIATITVDAVAGTLTPLVAAADGFQCGSIVCSDDFPALTDAGVSVPVAVDEYLLVAVGTASAGESGIFDLSIDVPDLFATFGGDCGTAAYAGNLLSRTGATLVSVTLASSTGATFGTLACGGGSPSQLTYLWYAPTSGELTVSASGSSQVVLDVYEAAGCSSQACEASETAQAVVTVTGAGWYTIVVGSSEATVRISLGVGFVEA